jgi:adenylylsulfate kinase
MSKVFWLTGLSGAGKTTLANIASHNLRQQGYNVCVLDGDRMRQGLCKDLSFSIADREENIRRVAEVAKLFIETNVIVIASLISPLHQMRSLAQEIIGANSFYEIYIHAAIETCEQRDVKGLYNKARHAQIRDFTGVSSIYEAPLNPACKISTDEDSIDISANKLLTFIYSNVSK